MGSRYPKVQIVDAPTVAANVLFDFQDDTSTYRTKIDNSSWEFPELDLLGDPDAIGVDWALGQVKFKQIISGNKPNALARQAALVKAMLRRRFWVLVQLSASTTPVWWYAYRTPPGALSMQRVLVPQGGADSGSLDRWEITGVIDVDPFSYAARVTQATKTIGNNPANEPTTPATGYTLPTIRGDSPTRLRVQVQPTGITSATPGTCLIAAITTTRANPVIRIPVGTGDSFAAPTNIPTASNADAIGGTWRAGTTTAIGATPTIQGLLPPGSAPRGRYLVLVHVGTTSPTTIAMQLQTTTNFYALGSKVTAVFDAGGFQWVSLGVMSIGDGVPTDIASADASTRRLVKVTATTTSPGDTVGIDDFLLVPISGADIVATTTLVAQFNQFMQFALPGIFDGDDEFSWLKSASDNDLTLITATGGYPVADPSAPTTLLVLPMRNDGLATNSATRLASTFDVTVSYLPRAAWIGDGAT